MSKKKKKNYNTKRVQRRQLRNALADFIAPAEMKVGANHIKMGNVYSRTLFLNIESPYIVEGWLAPIINIGYTIDISLFMRPITAEKMLKTLQRQLVSVEAEALERQEKGLIRDPLLDIARQNIEELRNKIQTAQEKMFVFGAYITIYSKSLQELHKVENEINNELKNQLIYSRQALYQQTEGITSTLPYNKDMLKITQPLNTLPLSSAFPFVSFNLSSESGILWGEKLHHKIRSVAVYDVWN